MHPNMKRYPSRQSVLEAILTSVDAGKTIRSIDTNSRDASLYKEACQYFGGYYIAVEQAAQVRRETIATLTLEELKTSVLEGVRKRWEQEKSIHPDEVVREQWKLYWQGVVAFGTYEKVVEAFGQKPAEILARRLWPRPQVDMVLQRLYRNKQDMSVTAMTSTTELKRLHTAARRAYGTYEKALEANSIPIDKFRRQRKVTDEMVVEEMVAYARTGKDMREWRVIQDPDSGSMVGNARDHFGTYRQALTVVQGYLLTQGETRLAAQFDYDRLQEKTRRERQQKRKRKVKEDFTTLHSSETYHREDLEKLLERQWTPEDFNALFEDKETVTGSDIRVYLRYNPHWATPAKLSVLLDCSEDNIKRHKIYDIPEGVIVLYTGSTSEYFIDVKYKDTLRPRSAEVDRDRLDPTASYTLKQVAAITKKSKSWWHAALGLDKTKKLKRIAGLTVLNILTELSEQDRLFTLTEAGRAIGISEYRARQFVSEGYAVPVQREPILLDKKGVDKLEDLLAHEIDAVHCWEMAVHSREEYRYYDLIMMGLPYSGIYLARRKGFLPARTDENGRALFLGEDLLTFLSRYNSSYVTKFSRGISLREETLYTPEEIVRLTKLPVNAVKKVVARLLERQEVIMLQAGEMKHYLIQKSILEEHFGLSLDPIEKIKVPARRGGKIDPVIEEYISIRDHQKEIEQSIGLDLKGMQAVADHLRRGTYSRITKHSIMTAEEFLALYQAHRKDSRLQRLAGKVVQQYEGLIAAEAAKLRGFDKEELMNEGRSGLLYALERVDAASGFIPYARACARGYMLSFIRTATSRVHISQGMRNARRKVSLVQAHNPDATPRQIAQETGLSPRLVQRVLEEPAVTTQSLDSPLRENDDRLLEEVVADVHAEEPGSALEKEQILNALREALGSLPERERKILVGTIVEEKDKEQVGKEVGLSRSGVREVEARALARLKKKLRRKGIIEDE